MKTNIKIDPKYGCQLEGEFLGFLPNSEGKLKHIQFRVGERILPIKLAKEMRKQLVKQLVEGDRLLIYLEQTDSRRICKLKLKSYRIEKLNLSKETPLLEIASPQPEKNQKGKILLCHKSSCAKRGGSKLYRSLLASLKQLGLQDRVKVELTGCQKQCKKAPSLILMPGKVKHTYVHPQDLTALLKTHYL